MHIEGIKSEKSFASRPKSIFFKIPGISTSTPVRPPEISSALAEVARLEPQAVFAHLGSNADGLTADEAETRLEKFGKNLIAREHRRSIAQLLAERLVNPLNVMLLVLVVINLFVLDDLE